jgi:ribose-phosphate pyrophosphokinase
MKLFTGNAHRALAEEIASYLGVHLGKAVVEPFADGEIYVRIGENVRGCDVFVRQPTCKSVNHNLVELSIMIDALRRASAERITAVIPYYGYARQDRKALPREPITAKLVANLLCAAGAKRILTIDLHSGQIQGFFDIPLDHLYALPILKDYLQKKNLKDVIVVSPDVGGVKKASKLASEMDAPLVILDKRRPSHNTATITSIIGEAKGKNAIIIDDLIDTGGTIAEAANALKKEGAKEIYVAATHALFSPPAIQRLRDAPVKEVIVTNTVPVPQEARFDKLKILSVAPLIGEAIRSIHLEESVSQIAGPNFA